MPIIVVLLLELAKVRWQNNNSKISIWLKKRNIINIKSNFDVIKILEVLIGELQIKKIYKKTFKLYIKMEKTITNFCGSEIKKQIFH